MFQLHHHSRPSEYTSQQSGVPERLDAAKSVIGDILKDAKRTATSGLEPLNSRHDNSEFMQAVSQLSPTAPIFHALTPATVHASRVDVAILPIKPLSPGAISGVREPYLPGAQLVQVLAPAPAYSPAGQVAQPDAPAATYLPVLHSEQAPSAVAPTSAENLPAAQLVQVLAALAPRVAEYLPLGHGTQSVAASLPSVARYLPAAQLVHVDAP